jgi:FtsZ-binding cell division protein ZapB
LSDAAEEKTVRDDRTAIKARQRQLRSKLNVPRERFRSLVSKPGHYI